VQSHQSKTTNFEAEILEAFKAFDHSGSGMISSEELLRCLTRLGQKMHPQTAAAFVKAANRHGQDMVNYRELARLLTR
jgi:Ca2+-binding EF-hand superfamily protein